MLEEVLETRVMVKQAMKTAKPNKVRSFPIAWNPHEIIPGLGSLEGSRRSTTGPKIYRECYVRIHQRKLLRPHAVCRDCG